MLAVATAGSTVKAASVLHVTQSAVSRGLLLAEDKLGLKLFDRTTRGLSPTPAGARLLAGASALLAQLVDLERSTVSPDAPPRRGLTELAGQHVAGVDEAVVAEDPAGDRLAGDVPAHERGDPLAVGDAPDHSRHRHTVVVGRHEQLRLDRHVAAGGVGALALHHIGLPVDRTPPGGARRPTRQPLEAFDHPAGEELTEHVRDRIGIG